MNRIQAARQRQGITQGNPDSSMYRIGKIDRCRTFDGIKMGNREKQPESRDASQTCRLAKMYC